MPTPVNVPSFVSAAQLTAAWENRDLLYGIRRINGVKSPLTERERESVLAWRRREAESLPADDRNAALDELAHWKAPVVVR